MPLPDIKNVGVVATFIRWGSPWHGLCRDGVLTLPNGATKILTQPIGGEVSTLIVPGHPVNALTPAEVAADLAAGMVWFDYALLSGTTRAVYGKPLGSINNWIWARSAGERWKVSIGTAPPISITATSLAYSIVITLTEYGKLVTSTAAAVTHTFTVSGTLSGTWDYGTVGFSTTVGVADVSSDGRQVILQVNRPGIPSRKGAQGFILLNLIDTASGSVTVIADWAACNPNWYTIVWTNYPIWGTQTDGKYLPPYTIWAWFNAADAVEQVTMYYTFVQLYPGEASNPRGGSLEIGLKVGGLVVTKYRCTSPDTSGRGPANFDGLVFADGNFQAFTVGANSQDPNPLENARLFHSDIRTYYGGVPRYPSETPEGNAEIRIEPVIYSNKTVGLYLRMAHTILGQVHSSGPVSDHYYGNVIYPGGVDAGVVRAVLETSNYTGSITGSVLTVSAVSQGLLAVGAVLSGGAIAANTIISTLGTGTGGAGTYNVTIPQSVASGAYSATYSDKANTTYQPKTGELTRNDSKPVCYV